MTLRWPVRLERTLFLTFGLIGTIIAAPVVGWSDPPLGWLIMGASGVLLGLGLFLDE